MVEDLLLSTPNYDAVITVNDEQFVIDYVATRMVHADDSWNAQTTGEYRHVRSRASVLSYKSGNAMML